jgi:hypothetical protein
MFGYIKKVMRGFSFGQKKQMHAALIYIDDLGSGTSNRKCCSWIS